MWGKGTLLMLAVLLALVASLLWFGRDRDVAGSASRQPEVDSALASAPATDPDDPASWESKREGAVEARLPADPAESGGAVDGLRDSHDAARELRGALDASVFERIDLGSILGVAEQLLELEVDPGADPEPDRRGVLRFPIIGVPEGVSAQLVAGYSKKFAHALGLEVQLEEHGEPHFLDGAPRAGSSFSLTAFLDEHGDMQHVSVLTNVHPHYEQIRLDGIDFSTGRITEGVTYRLDLSNPRYASMTAHGFIDGTPSDWEIQPVVDGETVYPARFEILGGKLLAKYDQLKHRER